MLERQDGAHFQEAVMAKTETKAVATRATGKKVKLPAAKAKGTALEGLRKASEAIAIEENGALSINGEDNPFAELGGSASTHFNNTIFLETISTQFIEGEEGSMKRKANVRRVAKSTVAALCAFHPKDEIEAMMAAQAVATHFASMECFRRVVQPGQTYEATSKLRRDGANLARGMADMVEALDRKRGKGPQVVRVERVIVQEGAQAIVGNVSGAPAGAPAALEAPSPIPLATMPGVAQRVGRG